MSRDKRTKFSDRWRQVSEPSIARSVPHEFELAGKVLKETVFFIGRDLAVTGLQELKQDPDYAEAKSFFQREPKSEEQSIADDEFLSSYADDLSMVLTVHLERISQWKNCLMFDGNYTIQSQIKAVEEK